MSVRYAQWKGIRSFLIWFSIYAFLPSSCSDKEAKAIVDLIQQYFIALSKENPQAAAEIGQGMPSCLPPSTYDRVSNDKTSSNGTGILPCAIEVGKNVTEQYELATVWEVFEPVLLGHLENITSCASAGNEEAVQACIAKERKSARRTYMEFLAAVKEVRFHLMKHGYCKQRYTLSIIFITLLFAGKRVGRKGNQTFGGTEVLQYASTNPSPNNSSRNNNTNANRGANQVIFLLKIHFSSLSFCRVGTGKRMMFFFITITNIIELNWEININFCFQLYLLLMK